MSFRTTEKIARLARPPPRRLAFTPSEYAGGKTRPGGNIIRVGSSADGRTYRIQGGRGLAFCGPNGIHGPCGRPCGVFDSDAASEYTTARVNGSRFTFSDGVLSFQPRPYVPGCGFLGKNVNKTRRRPKNTQHPVRGRTAAPSARRVAWASPLLHPRSVRKRARRLQHLAMRCRMLCDCRGLCEGLKVRAPVFRTKPIGRVDSPLGCAGPVLCGVHDGVAEPVLPSSPQAPRIPRCAAAKSVMPSPPALGIAARPSRPTGNRTRHVWGAYHCCVTAGEKSSSCRAFRPRRRSSSQRVSKASSGDR